MSKNIDVALRVAEKHNERELNSKISARMRASASDMGHVDSLQSTICTQVASENYTRAADSLSEYLESKSDYPQFALRSERYFNYANDLVNAVKAKRSFPGLSHLSMSKQQELFDKAMEHFEDLKITLKKIEQIDQEVRLEDVRSTVWVVKALIYSVFSLLVLAFLLEVSTGLLPTAIIVVDDLFGSMVNWAFDKIGF